ncbi:unnamed protein product, partial [Mesorhabditis belari]|uniref:VWFA domain-containing protein n=1 Tax=Mesorhabditis belari TaxID=2138241 RepID=A0AAF3EE66_9BILA
MRLLIFLTLIVTFFWKSLGTNACQSDLLFLIDSSGSVHEKWTLQLESVSNIISKLDLLNEKISVIVYASKMKQRTKIRFDNKLKTEDLQKMIKELPFFSGITATGAALRFAKKELENRRKHLKTNVVFVTDGFSYDNVTEPAKELHSLSDLRLFAISVNEPNNQEDLEILAGTPERVLKGTKASDRLVEMIRNECQPKMSDQLSTKEPTVSPLKSCKKSQQIDGY